MWKRRAPAPLAEPAAEGPRARARPGMQHVAANRRERGAVGTQDRVVLPGDVRVVDVRVAVREALARDRSGSGAPGCPGTAGRRSTPVHTRIALDQCLAPQSSASQGLFERQLATWWPYSCVSAYSTGTPLHGLAGHVHALLGDAVAGDGSSAAAEPLDLARRPDVHGQAAELGPVQARVEEVDERPVGRDVVRIRARDAHAHAVPVRGRVRARGPETRSPRSRRGPRAPCRSGARGPARRLRAAAARPARRAHAPAPRAASTEQRSDRGRRGDASWGDRRRPRSGQRRSDLRARGRTWTNVWVRRPSRAAQVAARVRTPPRARRPSRTRARRPRRRP